MLEEFADAALLKVPKFKKSTSRKAVIYKGSVEWNRLDSKVRNIEPKDKFKEVQRIGLKILVDRAGLGADKDTE